MIDENFYEKHWRDRYSLFVNQINYINNLTQIIDDYSIELHVVDYPFKNEFSLWHKLHNILTFQYLKPNDFQIPNWSEFYKFHKFPRDFIYKNLNLPLSLKEITDIEYENTNMNWEIYYQKYKNFVLDLNNNLTIEIIDLWENLCNSFIRIEKNIENPLLKKIEEIFDENLNIIKKSIILKPKVSDSNYTLKIQNKFSNYENINLDVLSAKRMYVEKNYSDISVLIGNCVAFEYKHTNNQFFRNLLISPVSKENHILQFDIDKLTNTEIDTEDIKLFPENSKKIKIYSIYEKKELNSTKENKDSETYDTESFDISALISKNISTKSQKNIKESDKPCVCLILADDYISYISKDDTKIKVIDTSTPEVISDYDVNNLNIGQYILLREDSSNDYIKEIAEQRYLKNNVNEIYKVQAEWKNELNYHIKNIGIQYIQKGLKLINNNFNPSEITIRNWGSKDNIGPGSSRNYNQKDIFKAILKIIRKESNYQKYWNTIEVIRKCHIDAGKFLSKKLIQIIDEKYNIDTLDLEETIIFNDFDKFENIIIKGYKIHEIILEESYQNINNIKKPININELQYG